MDTEMFRLHCNECHLHPEPESSSSLQLSRCHHILCGDCIEKISGDKKCPKCGNLFQGIPITREMPSGVANYFEDPNRFLCLYRKISKFQADQRTSDNLGFYIRKKRYEKQQQKMEAYRKLEAQLDLQIKLEKERNNRMVEYIGYHERLLPSSMDESSTSEDCGGLQRRLIRRHSFSGVSEEETDSFSLDSDTDLSKEMTPKPVLRRGGKRASGGELTDFYI